ncbi:hypothetical protein [Acinetobacter lwoffii]|uniref:hypothetical protein n=1 Tax=Acinetobacter lwoffii TaxID=28090 RepID=UPI0002CEA10E|nr:hypothetical protein [Acinetobacter lwoffii]ENW28446.1 hypothetical protein F924_01486 [Acinetobacter lwoffii ATCC 9957 = CIP 70.31]
MAMKQTQTKMFDFSDVGLDFCAGSKNLFPDRFKKMLSLGYNEQTVSSVAVSGNQVTFTYGGTHGYVADRVLKVSAPELLNINDGEFVIDSVTANTITMTIDGAPASIAGNFITKVASLGWEIVYEQAHIQVYKFRHIDDTDMYARLCFQNATTTGNRNCIAVGVGRTVDLATGHITDQNCPTDLATCATVLDATSNLRWDFTDSTARAFDNYTYTRGYSSFGKAIVVGSIYHFLIMSHVGSYTNSGYTQGIMPTSLVENYSEINYPCLICSMNRASTTAADGGQAQCIRFYAGKTELYADPKTRILRNIAKNSFVSIDTFNTTIAKPMLMHEATTGQFLGCIVGLYQCMYDSSNKPSPLNTITPQLSFDIDLENMVYVQSCAQSSTDSAYLLVIMEEIKIVD